MKSLFGLTNGSATCSGSAWTTSGGIEISTATAKAFKACIGAKSYTHIDGEPDRSTHVFEGMFDYLTYLTMHDQRRPRGNAYILHSGAMVDRVQQAIKRAERNATVILWLDSDAAGVEASQRMFDALDGYPAPVAAMNYLYEGVQGPERLVCSNTTSNDLGRQPAHAGRLGAPTRRHRRRHAFTRPPHASWPRTEV